MEKTKNMLKIVAKSAIPVLLQGESGVGKEVAARFVHEKSCRSQAPFVAINCGAIAQNLMESILEGSVKGAFTGAHGDKKGMVQAAAGGTLFLDEIGELPLGCQSKLLRILQEKTVLPVGATNPVPVDFRLVCATNRDLRQEVIAGNFREDLFFRISAFPISIPPLRERNDFEEVVGSVWRDVLEDYGDMGRATSDRATSDRATAGRAIAGRATAGTASGEASMSYMELRALRTYSWPGNIRQLKNVLQRYALMKPYGIELQEILSQEFSSGSCFDRGGRLLDFHRGSASYAIVRPGHSHLGRKPRCIPPEWELIKTALQECGNNKSRAAEKLGVSRGCIDNQIRKFAAFAGSGFRTSGQC